jgi:hypothetical protein
MAPLTIRNNQRAEIAHRRSNQAIRDEELSRSPAIPMRVYPLLSPEAGRTACSSAPLTLDVTCRCSLRLLDTDPSGDHQV